MVSEPGQPHRPQREPRLWGAQNEYTGEWATIEREGERIVLWYHTQAEVEHMVRLRMLEMGVAADQWPEWWSVTSVERSQATRISQRVRLKAKL